MRISEAGLNAIKRYEALRLHSYPDSATPLARATPGKKWGFVPAAMIMELLPPEVRSLSGNPWTIGYGTTMVNGIPVYPDMTCTIGQAEQWLEDDVMATEIAVNDAVKVPIAQGMYDALVSWAYNIGIGAMRKSSLIRLLNNHQYVEAQAEFDKWIKAGGKSNSGLMARRNLEQKMFDDAIRNILGDDPEGLADFNRLVEERDL